jgi:hypothetical protein
MSYYEEIVAEYLCSERTRFVSPSFNLDLGGAGPFGKGRNWWIDILAVDFEDQAVYLCEATFAQQPNYMFRRLKAWAALWSEIRENLFLVTHAPISWNVIPWVFAPANLESKIRQGIEAIPNRPFDYKWRAFEEIVPWKRQQHSAIATAEKKAREDAEQEVGLALGPPQSCASIAALSTTDQTSTILSSLNR